MITLLGLGASPETQASVDGFLQQSPSPSVTAITDFLKLFPAGPAREEAAQALIAKGADASRVASSMRFLEASGSITKNTIYGLLATASAVASGYHGIKRNNGSIGWGLVWFIAGGMFPVITPIVAVARKPGFAKAK
jgi:hypothetical protein